MTVRRWLTALTVGVGACALLLLNTAALVGDTDYAELGAYRRLWSDLARGIAGYLDAEYPAVAERAVRRTWAHNPVATTRRLVVEKVTQQEIHPWQFWRVVKVEPFIRERISAPHGAYDDLGRGLLLGTAFRVRGGIAPFLILWLAPLLVLPIVVWTAFESVRARVPLAGAGFLALLGLSPYALESLSQVRSAVGFYLVALVAVVPLAIYGLLGPRPSRRGLIVRWAGAGILLGVCALCRSGALFVFPAVLVILAVAVRRLDATRGERIQAAALALFVVAAPYLLLRQPHHHDVWAAVWEGLGDYDRTKGHVWSDPVAEERVRRDGAPARLSEQGMALMRADVIAHVTDDPMWYAGILARRTAAVVTQRRLWPSIRSDGSWMERSRSANEGFMDKYYAYTTTVEFLGFGNDRQVELPIVVMILPTLALFGWAAADRSLLPPAAVVAVLMMAALPLPVLITTAGAMEPQAFALAYGLGAAFLAEALVRHGRNKIGETRRINGKEPGVAHAPLNGDR